MYIKFVIFMFKEIDVIFEKFINIKDKNVVCI